ncbi:MAG: amidohydrolase family protein [Desulfobulbaceae bacterium]|nr:amidohydrolase family protein [Desulfobulbaceae bacterium]
MEKPDEFQGTKAQAGNLLICNARVIDGTEGSIREGVSILIREGQIEKIDENISADGIPLLNVNGAYVLPGLIDSHVHLMWGPGVLIQNSEVTTEQNWKNGWGKYSSLYLKAYLACGVTTVLDAGSPSYVVRAIRNYLSENNPGPRYLALGPFIAPPGGYGTRMEHTVSTPQKVEERLNGIQALHTHGIKTSIEKGWCPGGIKYVRHSPEILTAIKRAADRRNLPIYVHASCEEDQTTALKLGVHALAHTLIARQEEISDEFIELMKDIGTYQISTLSTMDAELTYYDTERLEDPLLVLTSPDVELSTAKDIQKRRLVFSMSFIYGLPWPFEMCGRLVKFFQRFPRLSIALFFGLLKLFHGKRIQQRSLENSKNAIFRLYNAGVPIVMGSDSVYSPSAIYAFHGITSLREIELLGEAGLPPQEAIKAATLTPAKMLGLANEIGTIGVGKRADLAIVRQNPLENLRALRTIQWTVKDGIALTPKEWMNQ